MKMEKNKIEKKDGRYLIYYEFKEEDDGEFEITEDFSSVEKAAEETGNYQVDQKQEEAKDYLGKERKEEGEVD